jgi:hypothetical protein
MAGPTPSLTALLVCDMVIEDKITNKKTIVGAFTDIWAHSFPCTHPAMGVYFCLTDAEGEYEIVLRLVNSDSGDLLAEAGLTVNIANRLGISDFGINLPMMTFMKHGRYEFQLHANKEFLGRKEFRVTKVAARNQ